MDINGIVVELNETEKEWWKKTITSMRKAIIRDPMFFVEQVIKEKGYTKETIEHNMDNSIKEIREAAWQLYLLDEIKFHHEVIAYLISNREYPANLLKNLIASNFTEDGKVVVNPDELFNKLSHFVGEYAGKIMPYIYELSLSTTNSRRARSGKTFEAIVKELLKLKEVPFEDQSSLGEGFFKDHNVGKIVDMVIPSRVQYENDRARTVVITMKTSLRERWQEVVEELRRTNIPSIYLLTVDENLTQGGLTVMKQHNIKVVVYDSVKKEKFEDYTNVIGFTQFFGQEIPHYLNYWEMNK